MIRDTIFDALDKDRLIDKFASLCTWLEPLRASVTADKRRIYNYWTAEAFYNALRLSPHIASVSKMLGGQMTSGYRCPELNAAVGGDDGSKHMECAAVDHIPKGFASLDAAAQAVLVAAKAGELGPVREIIPEYKKGTVHVDWHTRGQTGAPRIVYDSRY